MPGMTDKSEIAALVALSDLVAALDRVHDDPQYQSVWMIAQMHQGPYRGETYTEALETARAIVGERGA